MTTDSKGRAPVAAREQAGAGEAQEEEEDADELDHISVDGDEFFEDDDDPGLEEFDTDLTNFVALIPSVESAEASADPPPDASEEQEKDERQLMDEMWVN